MIAAIRSRLSDIRGSALGVGMPPGELWGVAQRDLSKPRRNRGEAARARRRAKRQAKALGMPLKAYLRNPFLR